MKAANPSAMTPNTIGDRQPLGRVGAPLQTATHSGVKLSLTNSAPFWQVKQERWPIGAKGNH